METLYGVRQNTFDDVKKVLKAAHESGTLKQAYFELSSIQQTELRDFANGLRAS